MKHIEIPYEQERDKVYRLFEILPGTLSWTILALPIILSLINPAAAALFILVFILIFFARSMAVTVRALAGYRMMREHEKIDWLELTREVELGVVDVPAQHRPAWHHKNLLRLQQSKPVVKPSDLVHAVIVAVHRESRDIVEPTIKSIIDSNYDVKKNVIFVYAYEERGGPEVEKQAKELTTKYAKYFKDALCYKHPAGIAGEVMGKGSNITHAGRRLAAYIEKHDIDPMNVVVTTLDCDHRPHRQYLPALTYMFCVSPDPLRAAYQPLQMFSNNIWDAPAPMRVIAAGNSYFYLMLTQRPHLQRNFAAHAQSLKALIDMDFWSMRTIVEDGHHFWRSYFHFDGNYRVYPIAVPIYCDAVLSDTYWKTLRAQFVQLRRWTYGASDFPFIVKNGFFRKNKIPRADLIPKALRHLEGHVHWAVGAILLALAAFVPSLLNPESYIAYMLPTTVSRIQTIGLVGIFASLFVCLKTLPPRPLRYKRHRTAFMVLQWLYLPVTNIVFSSVAALNSQTRLMFKRYLTVFDATEKSVKK